MQRPTKPVTVHRVTLQPLKPKGADASRCKFHRRDNRTIFDRCGLIHTNLFVIRFTTLFSQEKELRRSIYSATFLQEFSLEQKKDNLNNPTRFNRINARASESAPGLL